MSAEVHAFARPGSTGRPPLVPGNVDVSDADIMASSVRYQQRRSARMSAEHFGVWSRLQIASHLEKITGTLPDDDIDLAIAAGFTAEGVERWLAMKAKVLEDWLLCADGRWHHPMRARNVLHIWIGGRERDRRSALGNKGKSAKARACIMALEDAIEFGRDALARIDPQDRFLLALDERISRWPSKADASDAAAPVEETTTPAASSAPYYDSDGDREPRNTTLTATVNETKRNELNPDSDMPDRRSGDPLSQPEEEIEGDGTNAPTVEEVRATYPPDGHDQFYERFPLHVGRKRSEEAFNKVRDAGRIAFPDLMGQLEHYRRTKPPNQDPCHPVKWLNSERYLDGPALSAPKRAGEGPPGAACKVFVAVGTPPWRAWHDEARRQQRVGWPSSMVRDGKNGWEFDSEWPPGVDPGDHGADPRGPT